jgi:hypothetical protein
MKFKLTKGVLEPSIKAYSIISVSEFTYLCHEKDSNKLHIFVEAVGVYNKTTVIDSDLENLEEFNMKLDSKKLFKVIQSVTTDEVNFDIAKSGLTVKYGTIKATIAYEDSASPTEFENKELQELNVSKDIENIENHTAICSALGTSIFYKKKIISIDSKQKHAIAMSKAGITIPSKIDIGEKEGVPVKMVLSGASMSIVHNTLLKVSDDSKTKIGLACNKFDVAGLYLNEEHDNYTSYTFLSSSQESEYNSIAQVAVLAEAYSPPGYIDLDVAVLSKYIKLSAVVEGTASPEMIITTGTDTDAQKISVQSESDKFNASMESSNNVDANFHINGKDLEKILKRAIKHDMDLVKLELGAATPALVIRVSDCTYFIACIGAANSATYKVKINDTDEVVRDTSGSTSEVGAV